MKKGYCALSMWLLQDKKIAEILFAQLGISYCKFLPKAKPSNKSSFGSESCDRGNVDKVYFLIFFFLSQFQ